MARNNFISKALRLPIGTQTRAFDPNNLNNTLNNLIADQMGPGEVAPALPLDNSGLPRKWPYRVGWNLPSEPGEGRIDFDTLITLSESYDVLRKCIEIRKDEVARLAWDITPVEGNPEEKRLKMEQNAEKIKAAKKFFKKPDKRYTWQDWIRSILEDHFVLDAVSVYKHRTFGGDLLALEQIDGSTVKPLLDVQGRTPLPPHWGYSQYLYGIARDNFTTEELIYAPKNRRPRSPYGFSPVEYFTIHINLALRHQIWTTSIFTDGNIPQQVMTAPEKWSADQIAEFQDLWDALLAGNPHNQRMLRIVPNGFANIATNNDGYLQFSREMTDYIINLTAICMDVTRQELGLEPSNTDGLGGSGHGVTMAGVQYRRSLLPLCAWLSTVIFNPLLEEEFGLEGFEWTWPSLTQQDPKAAADLNQVLLTTGQKSLDEVLIDNGQKPVGIGRFFQLGSQFWAEKDLIEMTKMGALAYQAKAQAAAGAAGMAGSPQAQPKPVVAGTANQQQLTHHQQQGQVARQQVATRDTLGAIRAAKPPGPIPPANGAIQQLHAMKAAEPSVQEIMTDIMSEKAVELRKWQRKSLKSLKERRSASVDFLSSGAIVPEEIMDIRLFLTKAASPDEVRQVFDRYFPKGG